MALADDKKTVILQLAQGGLSIRAIASATGHSKTTIQKYLADWFTEGDTIWVHSKKGLDGKNRPSRRYDITERDEAIKRLHFEGKTQANIASEVGCSTGTVSRVLGSRFSVHRGGGDKL